MDHPALLQNLLLRLDCGLEDAEIVTAREVQAWPSKAFDMLIESGILVTHPLATGVACEDCSEGHLEEADALEYSAEPTLRYFIACPTCGRVEIPPDKLRRWKIDLSGVAKTVGRLLKASGPPKEVVPQRVWDLGWAEIDATVHDFLLVRGLRWPGAQTLDPDTRLTGRNSPIVLTLCEAPSPPVEDAPAIPVSRVLNLDDGGLTLDARYLAALPARETRDSLPTVVQGEYSFARRGRLWVTCFEGRQCVFPRLEGFRYIAHLLANPNKEIPAVDLARLGTRGAGMAATGSQGSSVQELVHEGISVGFGDAGEVLDDQAKSEYRERVRQIEGELLQLDTRKDATLVQRLNNEKAALLKELGAATGLGGRDRRVSSTIDRSRSAVRHTIERALKRIAEQDQAMAKFLTNSITTGSLCMYHPDRNISWRLDLLKTRHP